MWLEFWKLASDPFLGPARGFVSTPGHDEAVARLVAAITTAQRLAVLRGAPGLGKTSVLTRALVECRGPGRRVSRVVRPGDGMQLLAALAEGLGTRVPPGSSHHAAWRQLADAVRVCHWQKVHPILVVDDVGDLVAGDDRRDLARLVHLCDRSAGPLTVVQTVCETGDDDGPPPSRWELSTRLLPLTRSETERYVAVKLAAASRDDPAFTPRALGRLHDLSMGVPRGIDRLASLALMAGAWHRRELVTPEVVDGVARECSLGEGGHAA